MRLQLQRHFVEQHTCTNMAGVSSFSSCGGRRHIGDESGDAMGPVASQSQVAVALQPAAMCLCPHCMRSSRPQPATTPSEHRPLCAPPGAKLPIWQGMTLAVPQFFYSSPS
jgi:hypothetical protein